MLRLLEGAMAEARERSYRKLMLQVLSTNLTAQRLYERAGAWAVVYAAYRRRRRRTGP